MDESASTTAKGVRAPPSTPGARSGPAEILLSWSKRLALWTFVCGVSAAPSFWWAYAERGESVAGMLAGVGVYVVLYAWVTGTPLFRRLHRKPFVARTLRIGYATRLLLSGWALATLAVEMHLGLLYVTLFHDLIAGHWSVHIVKAVAGRHLGYDDDHVIFAFLATVVEGAILNLELLLFMLVVYSALWRPPNGDSKLLCSRCGYDLRGNPVATVCPECGAEVKGELHER